MSLFKENNGFVEEDVTPSEAKVIYDLLKVKNESDIRREDGFRTHKVLQVVDEMNRLEREINLKMSGRYLLSEAVLDKDGKVVKEPVYFVPSTESALKNSLSSDLLDVGVVVVDVRLWSQGKPDEGLSWTDFKNSFLTE